MPLVWQEKGSMLMLFALLGATLLALVGGVAVARAVNSLDIGCFVAPLLIGLLFLGFGWPYLAFYALDEQGIQRNMLGQRRTLAWNTIDWIYGEYSSTIIRTRGGRRYVGRGTPTETRYVVEAGSRQRISIPLGRYGDARQVNHLMEMIGKRATHALVGRNRLNDVRARRAAYAGSLLATARATGSEESARR
jgi:hypothetical protein